MNAEAAEPKRSTDHPSWLPLLPLAGLVLSVFASALYGLPSGLIVIGATVLLVAIWNLWISLQLLAGDQPATAEGLDHGAPSAEQEQKAFLLRALEDLEFEHSVGKIDEEDYRELRASYRERAKRALAAAPGVKHPRRAEAERLAASYLKDKGIATRTPPNGKPDEKRSDP